MSLSLAAQSFPSVMLLRTMNPFTKEILEYVSLRKPFLSLNLLKCIVKLDDQT